MAQSANIPSNIASLPCVHTDVYIMSVKEFEAKIIRVCQRPATPAIVDIWYELSHSGNWAFLLEESGYQDSSDNWHILKPDLSDGLLDGTQTAADAAGTTWTTIWVNSDTPKQFRFVWDTAEYGDFDADAVINLHMKFVSWETSIYYPWRAVTANGTNNDGSQDSITTPPVDDEDSALILKKAFNKGFIVPAPVIDKQTNGLRITFSPSNSNICSCYAICNGESILGLCDDALTYILDIPDSSLTSGQVFSQDVVFEDLIGNQTTVPATYMNTVVPDAPTVQYTGGNVQVVVAYTGAVAGDLTTYTNKFQVEKYDGNAGSTRILFDWRDGTTTLLDTAPRKSRTYGYRVRFRSAANSNSEWSSWATLSI